MTSHGPIARTFDKVGANGRDRHPALHLHFGPIDLIIECEASPQERQRLFGMATQWFAPVLTTLAQELPLLRQTLARPGAPTVEGPIARRMVHACNPFIASRVTPMAAVAGAVADDCLACLTAATTATKLWINNGGDIAVWLNPEATLSVGMIADPSNGQPDGVIQLDASMGIGGIATSGRASSQSLDTAPAHSGTSGGRSFSLGIADAVTVLAHNAATADVAATLIANAVDLPGHAGITRTPATELDPDNDLGKRLVVTDVAPEMLDTDDRVKALRGGVMLAQHYCAQSLIQGAVIRLYDHVELVLQPELSAPHSASDKPSLNKRSQNKSTLCKSTVCKSTVCKSTVCKSTVCKSTVCKSIGPEASLSVQSVAG